MAGAGARGRGSSSGRPDRMPRVNELLREVLAEAIERISDADDRLALVTVTAVRCDTDLRHALVYLSELTPEAALVLDEHRKRLQASLAGQVRLRRTPLLAFAADPAIEAGRRVEDALRRVLPPPGRGQSS
jgi:ribosome-binding factor A